MVHAVALLDTELFFHSFNFLFPMAQEGWMWCQLTIRQWCLRGRRLVPSSIWSARYIIRIHIFILFHQYREGHTRKQDGTTSIIISFPLLLDLKSDRVHLISITFAIHFYEATLNICVPLFIQANCPIRKPVDWSALEVRREVSPPFSFLEFVIRRS